LSAKAEGKDDVMHPIREYTSLNEASR